MVDAGSGEMSHISSQGSEAEEIERQSFEFIEDRLSLPYPEKEVVARVVHATADFSFAELFVFKGDAIQQGVKAVLEGRNIITDVNMVKAGISPTAAKHGCRVKCFVADKQTKVYAGKSGITRARAAFRLNKAELEEGIVVVGNSPTALLELVELVRGGTKPALVVAAPVGFVKAKESKEEILKLQLPCIAVKGEKGGTPVAVAVVNALIRVAGKNEFNFPRRYSQR